MTNKYIIAIALGLSLSSCGDSCFDVAPMYTLSDATFWKTQKDAELALAGCYNNWENHSNIVYLDAASDNGYEQFQYGYSIIGNGQILPVSGWGAWYDKEANSWFKYTRIRKYNNFLKKVDLVEMDESVKNQYKAEVRFLRAYDYFYKVMLYGDIPLVTEVIDQPGEANLPRNPKEDVYQFILKELKEIANDLKVQNTIESKGHITQGAANALTARLLLYIGNYKEAMEMAEKVINMSCYNLYPTYEEMFREENEGSNKEVILDIQYMPNDYKNTLPQHNLPALEGGWSALGASWKMVEAYQMKNGKYINEAGSGYDENRPFKKRDPRLGMTILCPGEYYNGRYYNTLDKLIDGKKNLDYHSESAASRTGLLVKKFVKPMSIEEMNNYGGNMVVIRLSEMYLTYAECALKTGVGKDIALTYINEIRKRAEMPTVEKLSEDIIRYERRIELAFEGLRYFDVKRWNLGPEVMDGTLWGCREGSVNNETGEITWLDSYIKVEDRYFSVERNYLLPIPQVELDANPKMTQNPGY